MRILWKKEYATGLDWQDEQHQQIFEQLNKLQDAMQLNAGAGKIKELVGFLCDYTSGHLAEEEVFMMDNNCQSYREHKKAHTQFLNEFNELRQLYGKQGGSTVVVMRLHNMLRDWLIQHIMGVDQHMLDDCDE